jgi:hypothetical protein
MADDDDVAEAAALIDPLITRGDPDQAQIIGPYGCYILPRLIAELVAKARKEERYRVAAVFDEFRKDVEEIFKETVQ